MTAAEWADRAACRGVDPEIFFPCSGEVNDKAVAICGGCPVRVECAEFALADLDIVGIWGGLSHKERLRIRRGDRRAPKRRYVQVDGALIRRLRTEKGLTRAELARAVGCVDSTLSSAERGVHRVTTRLLDDIAAALDVSAYELIAEPEAVAS